MPLVMICGSHCTGKSTRAKEIAQGLEKRGKSVVIVTGNDEGVELTREQLHSAVEREIARSGVAVICDGVNDIRGFRYELFCLAKARSTPCLVLYCSIPHETSNSWNEATKKHTMEELEDSRRRFEPPSETNRWERPLFTATDPAVSLPIDQICSSLFESVAPKPNRSTTEELSASSSHVHDLDVVTREVVSAVLKASADPSFVPGDSVGTGSTGNKQRRTLVLPRKVGAAELGRLRRQFVRINEGNANTIVDPADSFVLFLASAL